MSMRRAVLMTRQAISPRFAIRIFLNIFFGLGRWAGFLANCGTAKPSRGNGLVLPRRTAPSARIGLESSPRIGMRDRLHQFGDLVFKIVVGDDQGADRRPQI